CPRSRTAERRGIRNRKISHRLRSLCQKRSRTLFSQLSKIPACRGPIVADPGLPIANCLIQRAAPGVISTERALTTPSAEADKTWLLPKLNAPSTPRNCAVGLKLPTYQLTTFQNPHGAIVAVQRIDEPPLPASLFSTNGIFPTDVSWNFPWLAARPSRKSN